MVELLVNPRCVTVSTEGIHLTLGEPDFGVQKNLLIKSGSSGLLLNERESVCAEKPELNRGQGGRET